MKEAKLLLNKQRQNGVRKTVAVLVFESAKLKLYMQTRNLARLDCDPS